MCNFWKSFDLPLINCETELDLKWRKNCVISEIYKTSEVSADPNANLPNNLIQATTTTGATFQINNAKLYVPVVTFSINDNIKLSENIKQGFKITMSWNKYRSEIATQPKSNNLDYLIDPTFRNINRLFVLLLKNGNNDPTRYSFDKYYMPLVEIKDFNVLIDNKPFFWAASKKTNEKHLKNLLKRQEINFTGKLEKNNGATMFFIAEKRQN